MKRLIVISILMLVVLSFTAVALADVETTSTGTQVVNAQTVANDVYTPTVVKEVYGVKVGYISLITDSTVQLKIIKGKKVDKLTFDFDALTKVRRVAGKNKVATLKDLKVGQYVKIIFRKADNSAREVVILPSLPPKAKAKISEAQFKLIKAQQKLKIEKQKAQKKLEQLKVKQKAKQKLEQLKAKQKMAEIKAKQKVTEFKAKNEVKKMKAEQKIKQQKTEIKEKIKSKVQEINQKQNKKK